MGVTVAFCTTFRVGKSGERQLQKLFSQAGIKSVENAQTSRKKLSYWDLKAWINGHPFLVEVKFDVMASRTGNLAIEYYNTRMAKPSGIKGTKADLWVVVLADPIRIYAARTSDLLQYCEAVRPFRNISCGGDDNAAMWLYPAEQILEAVFHRIDDIFPAHLPAKLATLLDGVNHVSS